MTRHPDESWDDFHERCEHMGELARDREWSRQTQPSTESKPMAMLGDYLLKLLERCSDQQFGQDAIQFGLTVGLIELTYNLERDCRLIMGEPGRPETGRYDSLCEAWRRECAETSRQLLLSYEEAGLVQASVKEAA